MSPGTQRGGDQPERSYVDLGGDLLGVRLPRERPSRSPSRGAGWSTTAPRS